MAGGNATASCINLLPMKSFVVHDPELMRDVVSCKNEAYAD